MMGFLFVLSGVVLFGATCGFLSHCRTSGWSWL